MIVRDALDNGLGLLTESMPDVRSVSLGVWLTRGSRHEDPEHEGIAHLAEHMLFKGTDNRSAKDIAQEVDSIGGHLDAFTAKECASYYIKVLDEHLPRAVDLLADLVRRPVFDADDLEKEKKVILEEIKMVEDTPDDLVHEEFMASFWPNHPLGRSILGTAESVTGITRGRLRDFFDRTYVSGNLLVAAAGHLEHEQVRDLIGAAFASLDSRREPMQSVPPTPRPSLVTRQKDLEQSHLVLGTRALPHDHDDRYASYVLNTILGGSMSSRLFQKVREERGLAYAVSSGLASYRDAGALTIYAGCDAAAVPEVVDVVVDELRTLRQELVPADELQRAKDHIKGNLVLGLESTGSRMSQMARSEMYFDRQIDVSENLAAIDNVSADDVRKVAAELASDGSLAATVLGPGAETAVLESQLAVA
jgi:predicted Zn-dependent peptidase